MYNVISVNTNTKGCHFDLKKSISGKKIHSRHSYIVIIALHQELKGLNVYIGSKIGFKSSSLLSDLRLHGNFSQPQNSLAKAVERSGITVPCSSRLFSPLLTSSLACLPRIQDNCGLIGPFYIYILWPSMNLKDSLPWRVFFFLSDGDMLIVPASLRA